MKKKYFAIVLLSVLILINIIVCFLGNSNDTEVARLTDKKDDLVVVLDAGHGGEDGGAVSSSGVIEADINLQITLKLKDILNLNGFHTILTRTDNSDLSDKSFDTIAKRKKSDMYKRLEIYNSDIHNVAISIHQNIFPATSCKGSQVFYSLVAPTGKELADNITASIVNILQKDNNRISKPTTGSIFLLDNAKIPAVIVECGFLSNDNEVITLCDMEYQKKFSYCVFRGFMNTKF